MATTVSSDISTIVYPESDGELMGETDAHVQAIIDTVRVLTEFFRLQPNVVVGGDMMMYYVEGNPRRSVSPDAFVVLGIPKYSRRTYKIWEEGVPPTVVFEFTSRSTGEYDIKKKPTLYASLGIQEYFLFDPLEEYLVPSFQGFRLVGSRYEPLTLDAEQQLQSEALGLVLRREGVRLRFIDARTSERLLWPDEEVEARRQAEERERVAQDQIAQLQAELARLRGDDASR